MQESYTQGLTEQQAKELLQLHGPNVIDQQAKSGFWRMFAKQFGDLMIVILLVAAALSLGMAIYSGNKGDIAEPIIIFAIVIANAVLGTAQEYRAEKSLNALKRLTMPQTTVVRDGKPTLVDSANVVVGDVCLFQAGNVVTADCQLLYANNLFVNQSALTGESLPVEKHPNIALDNGNLIFNGSFVTKGNCYARVLATGNGTELGKIALLMRQTQQSLTPLQQKLKQLSKVIGVVCLAVCLAVFIIGFAKGIARMRPGETFTALFLEVFLSSVSLAAAAIPEGLPAVVTVVLARGIEQMARKNAIVKRLTAVEALGSATVICTDKTGTLTQNKMTLIGMFDGSNYLLANNLANHPLVEQFCWCCDALQNDQGMWLGDPTEIAVTSVAQKPRQYAKLHVIPFDSDRKLMTVVVKTDNATYSVTKGSLDAMRTAVNYAKFAPANNLYAQKGLRVLALSVKRVDDNFDACALEQNLHIVALFTIADPPRPEAFDAVATCKSAGIRTVMITGDSLPTATQIATELGILNGKNKAISGDTLAKMTQNSLVEDVNDIAVYARATPADKLRIVKALQSCGNVVAMTGDGVNDAPALSAADIGCAMGSGTEVAKDAADIILTDDNFATVVHAVSLGRSVYQNIKKAVTYLLSCNIGEVLSVFFALLIWDVLPLSAMQLLWINLVTDGLPGLALGVYSKQNDVMNRPPYGKKENFFSGGSGRQVVVTGIFFAIATLVGYAVGNAKGSSYACTVAYLVLSLSQLFFVLEKRDERGIFAKGITPFMTFSFVFSVLMVALVMFVPIFRKAFGLQLLDAQTYAVAVALSLLPTAVNNVMRMFTVKKRQNVQQKGF